MKKLIYIFLLLPSLSSADGVMCTYTKYSHSVDDTGIWKKEKVLGLEGVRFKADSGTSRRALISEPEKVISFELVYTDIVGSESISRTAAVYVTNGMEAMFQTGSRERKVYLDIEVKQDDSIITYYCERN